MSALNDKVAEAVNWAEEIRSRAVTKRTCEELFTACRSLCSAKDERVRGLLMMELADRASRTLRKHVSRNLPDEGRGVITAAVDRMIEAALKPNSADAEGYATSFNARLRVRLADQIRSARLRGSREQAYARDEEGEDIPVPDLAQATPEQALDIATLLADADPRKRRALALVMQGYPVSSTNPDTRTVSSMLKVSARTTEGWVREMKSLVVERMNQ